MQFENILVHKSAFDSFRESVRVILADFHRKNPIKPGMLKEELRAHFTLEHRLFSNLITSLKDVIIEKELIRFSAFKVALSQSDEDIKTKIHDTLEKGGFQPPSKEELGQSLKMDQKRLSDILRAYGKRRRAYKDQ